MSDAPRFENRITAGNYITIFFGIVALAVAWGTLQADIRALAQRVDKGETRDEKAAEAINAMNALMIELRADSKATKAEVERIGRQLDRIESATRNHPAPVPKGVP